MHWIHSIFATATRYSNSSPVRINIFKKRTLNSSFFLTGLQSILQNRFIISNIAWSIHAISVSIIPFELVNKRFPWCIVGCFQTALRDCFLFFHSNWYRKIFQRVGLLVLFYCYLGDMCFEEYKTNKYFLNIWHILDCLRCC